MRKCFQIVAVMFAGISAARAQAPPPGGGQGRAEAPRGSAGTESGFAVFQTRCMGCHGNPAVERAPSPAAIREMSPEHIYEALTTGVMKGQGSSLSEDQRRMLATFMSGRTLGSEAQGDAKSMPNQCAEQSSDGRSRLRPRLERLGRRPEQRPLPDRERRRIWPRTRCRNLKLKWAFGYPTGLSAFGQPSVVSGRVFVGADTGYIYSLDAKTGCVYWSYKTKGSVRNAINVGPVKGRGDNEIRRLLRRRARQRLRPRRADRPGTLGHQSR